MWLECEFNGHKQIVNADRLDRIYISYKGVGNYQVVGESEQHEFMLKTLNNEKEAEGYVKDLYDALSLREASPTPVAPMNYLPAIWDIE